MNVAFLIVVLVCFLMGLRSYFKTRDILNPPTLTAIFFIIPLLINRLNLSGLQPEYWNNYTYLIIIYYVIIFSLIPGLILEKGKFRKLKIDYRKTFLLDKKVMVLLIIFSILIQVVLNYLNCGYFVPTLFLKKLQLQGVEFHTINVSFWGLVIESVWLFIVGVSVINSKLHRSKLLWFLTILSLLSPLLTRLSRMTLLLGLILLFFILYDLVKNRRKFYMRGLIVLLVFLFAGTYIMWYRWSVGGKYDVSFANEIKYKGNPGPMESFATFYGYFPLSFENIDRFVIKNKDNLNYTYGAYTFRPILAGLFKIQKIFPSYPMHEHFNKLRAPLTGTATVPTAVTAFTVDFGFIFSFLPMMLYSFLGLFLYVDGRNNPLIRFLYFVFAFSFVLSAFQNFYISPRFVYIVLLGGIFYYSHKLFNLKLY